MKNAIQIISEHPNEKIYSFPFTYFGFYDAWKFFINSSKFRVILDNNLKIVNKYPLNYKIVVNGIPLNEQEIESLKTNNPKTFKKRARKILESHGWIPTPMEILRDRYPNLRRQHPVALIHNGARQRILGCICGARHSYCGSYPMPRHAYEFEEEHSKCAERLLEKGLAPII